MLSSLLNFNYRQFLKWCLANVGMVTDLANLVQAFAAAPGWQSRWDILHEIGNLLLKSKPVDVPTEEGGVSAFAFSDEAKLEAELNARLAEGGYSVQAWDGHRIRKIWDTLQPFLPILLQLIQAA